jgi:outer membrane biosynthesis protein TonB
MHPSRVTAASRIWLAAMILGLAACASVPPSAPAPPPPAGEVNYHAVENKDARHYQLTPAETTVSPAIGPHNEPPIYPAALLARELPPVTVRATLIVDAHGRVTAVHFAEHDRDDPVRAAFERAVRRATRQWTFEPLLIQHWKPTADGGAKVVRSEPMPFSQAYDFRFALRNGKPVVTTGTP